jgi:hypothetical protein
MSNFAEDVQHKNEGDCNVYIAFNVADYSPFFLYACVHNISFDKMSINGRVLSETDGYLDHIVSLKSFYFEL